MSLSVIIRADLRGGGGVVRGGGVGDEPVRSGVSARIGQEDADSGLGAAVDPGEVSSIDHHPLRYDLDRENSFTGVEFGVPVLSNVPVEVECGTVLAAIGATVDEVEMSAPVAD